MHGIVTGENHECGLRQFTSGAEACVYHLIYLFKSTISLPQCTVVRAHREQLPRLCCARFSMSTGSRDRVAWVPNTATATSRDVGRRARRVGRSSGSCQWMDSNGTAGARTGFLSAYCSSAGRLRGSPLHPSSVGHEFSLVDVEEDVQDGYRPWRRIQEV